MKQFPPVVWATAFAALIAFMGIGVVDPILPIIGKEMGATSFEVEWLFTSYIGIMALAMLVSGVLATRLGGRKVVLIGLSLVVIFAVLSGLSNGIGFLAVMRGGWGLGNAFFTSTALSIMVGASSGKMASSVTLYEAALGLGLASGPLLGGLLGGASWRFPFFGTATLMAIALILTFILVKDPKDKEQARSAKDLFRALKHPPVFTNALIGMGYSYVFFTLLAYSPIVLGNLSSIQLGFTFFGWGILVGISSVFVVNWLRPLLGPIRLLQFNLICLVIILVLAAVVPSNAALITVVIISGFFCGISNAMFTTLAMEVSPFARSLSSGAYNFLRWAGAAVAPILSGLVGGKLGMQMPFWIGAVILAVACIVLFATKGVLEKGLMEAGHSEAIHHESVAEDMKQIESS